MLSSDVERNEPLDDGAGESRWRAQVRNDSGCSSGRGSSASWAPTEPSGAGMTMRGWCWAMCEATSARAVTRSDRRPMRSQSRDERGSELCRSAESSATPCSRAGLRNPSFHRLEGPSVPHCIRSRTWPGQQAAPLQQNRGATSARSTRSWASARGMLRDVWGGRNAARADRQSHARVLSLFPSTRLTVPPRRFCLRGCIGCPIVWRCSR